MEHPSITLVRHGETEANASDVWQGHGDSPLTERGQRQVKAFGERMQDRHFDVVVSSDLGRTVATAEALGRPFQLDEVWRELDMGEWDGMARSQIFSDYPDLLAELKSGKDVRWGGAETYSEFVARIDAALASLAASLEPGQHALVVAHGGVIHAVVAGLLGFRGVRRPWPVGRITNTSLTTISVDPRKLAVFNDAGHLGGDYAQHQDARAVTLVRHGETAANVRGWWHGTTDLELTPNGEQQAARVAAAFPAVGSLAASPLARARQTAQAIADRHEAEVATDGRLQEMDFGDWEGLTGEEIQGKFPDQWRAVTAGRDIPRGGSGETFGQVAGRMMEAARDLADGDDPAVAVSHGGSISALVATTLGLSHGERTVIELPRNVSTTTIRVHDDRMELTEFNASVEA